MSEKVINIMNFVRGIEPRFPADLSVTIINELEMCQKYGFENTVLLQYDAMIQPSLMNKILEKATDSTEFGLWFEMCRQLVETLGIEWKGREGYDWDWHVNSGFLIGYSNEQRVAIIDEVMRKFKQLFGCYPKSVGSWLIDSFSMQYASTDEILYKALVDSPLFPKLKNGECEEVKISEGEILKINGNGIITKEKFEYSHYYGRNWWDFGLSSCGWGRTYYSDRYIEDLKSIASYQGFSPDDIDTMLSRGFTPDEIEEYIYCMDGEV